MNFRKEIKEYNLDGLCALPANRVQKRPMCAWKKYQNQLPTEAELDRLKYEDAVCIVCGKVSGNLFMLDFDQAGKVYEAFKALCPPELFNRLIVETSQSGGFHGIGRSEGPISGNTVLAKDCNGNVLIETRGEGGLFLCAPTPGYEFIQGNFQNIAVFSEHEVNALFDLARTFNNCQPPTPPLPPVQPKRSAMLQIDGVRPGTALNQDGTLFIKNILQSHGWSYVRQQSQNDELWRRPGKNTGHSAYLHTDTPTFHVFSSNAAPFNEETYTYFSVYAMLEHRGDYSVAAKELARLGYGDKLTPQPVDLPPFIEQSPFDIYVDDIDEEEASGEINAEIEDDSDDFPEHLLNVPGLVGELSQFINETSFVVQHVFALASSLAFQALLCAQQIKDPTNARPNIYFLVTGRTSSGKERGRSVIKEIFTRLENRLQKDKYYDAKKFCVENLASYQALLRKLESNNGALLLLWDEIGKYLPTMNNDKAAHLSGIIPVIMSLYTSAHTTFMPPARADKDSTLPHIQQPNLVIYGTAVLQNLLNSFSFDSIVDGLVGRLMIFCGNDEAEERNLINVPEVPETIIDAAHWWLQNRTLNTIGAIPNPRTLTVTDEAAACFEQLFTAKTKAKRRKDEIEIALWGRSILQARQFALIYAASANPETPVVDKNAAQWATEIVTHLIKRKIVLAKLHIADNPFDKLQKEAIRYIRKMKGQCTKSEFTRRFQRIGRRKRDEIIDNLRDTKIIRIEFHGHGKASTEVIVLQESNVLT